MLQDEDDALSGGLNSFSCAQFLVKITAESENVVYKGIVENFISFPTV
jgi:hypothetical protein